MPRDGSRNLRAEFVDPADEAALRALRLQLRQLSDEKASVAQQAQDAVEGAFKHIDSHYLRLARDMYYSSELPEDLVSNFKSAAGMSHGSGDGASPSHGGGGRMGDDMDYEDEVVEATPTARAGAGAGRRADGGALAGGGGGYGGAGQRLPSTMAPTPVATSGTVLEWGRGAGEAAGSSEGGGGEGGVGGWDYGTTAIQRGPGGGITLPAGMAVRPTEVPRSTGGSAAAPSSREEAADESTKYCVCRGSFKGAMDDMIGCDREDECEGGDWFHLECVGLKAVPKGKWYCPRCAPLVEARRAAGGGRKR